MTYFFDLDGTVTDSREGIFNCVKYALESRGIAEPDYERMKAYIGPPLVKGFMEINGVDEETAIELLNKYSVIQCTGCMSVSFMTALRSF